MTTEKTDLLADVRAFAGSELGQFPGEFTYHNLQHTEAVVRMAEEIGKHEGLPEQDMETLLVAAWFHDLGYRQSPAGHESVSVDLARPFLQERGWSEERIAQVAACIMATRLPQQPGDFAPARVLCDADMSHLAADNYLEHMEALRQEIKQVSEKVGKKKWAKKSIEFMEHHQYFTAYGKKTLQPKKEENCKKLKKYQKQLEQGEEEGDTGRPEAPEQAFMGKRKRPDRGIETMFRVTSQNHFQLSAMADNKANIMISVNTIIVSLVLSILLRKLEESPSLIFPTALLILTCVSATVLAILATRPNVTEGKFSKEDIENKSANLLFFGNFHRMELSDYEWGMRAMMNDADFLYSAMTRDIYFLGNVLGRKYKLLRWSYTVFMFGFVLSVIAFGVMTMMASEGD